MVHSFKELATRGGDRTQWQYTYIAVNCKIMRQVVKILINADRKDRYIYISLQNTRFSAGSSRKDNCRAKSILTFFRSSIKRVVNFGYIGIRTQEIS